MRNIGVLGAMGSGKGIAAEYLSDRYGYRIINMGNIIRAIAKKRKIPPARLNLEKLQRECRRRYGDDYVIKEAVAKAGESGKPVILDGIRSLIDAKTAKKELGAKLILIYADPKLRFERLKRRRRADFPRTFAEFKKVEALENRTFAFGKTAQLADYTIDNGNGLKYLHSQLDSIMKVLKQG